MQWANPSREDVIFQASYCYKLARNYSTACDFGERGRIRNPVFLKNLVNLGDIYRLMGQRSRATMLLRECQELDPDNASVRKLSDVMEKLPV